MAQTYIQAMCEMLDKGTDEANYTLFEAGDNNNCRKTVNHNKNEVWMAGSESTFSIVQMTNNCWNIHHAPKIIPKDLNSYLFVHLLCLPLINARFRV